MLGSGFTNTNRLVRSDIEEPIKAYAMPRKIGQFEKIVDLTGATLIKTFSSKATDFEYGTPIGQTIAIKPILTSVACESVAFINENGELVMAINKAVSAGQSSDKDLF